MNIFNEVKEVPEKTEKEIYKKTKAFENKNDDVNKIRCISTINEGLLGKAYSGTNVEYGKKVFKLGGEKMEGVFPKFESKFDTVLPKDMRNASDTEQFKLCTKRLATRIENEPSFANKFTTRQIEQIKAGEPRISGLTWHHNEVPGKMQLVDAKIHETCRHTGGRSIWGGGSSYR